MGSHTSSGEWKSFEGRMRQRRAERLVLRASTAADSKLFDEARAAIDEARVLWPAAPGLTDIELRLPERPSQPLERPTQPGRPTQPERSPQLEDSTQLERLTRAAAQPKLSIQPERSTLQPNRSTELLNRSTQRPKRSTQRKEIAVAAAVTAFAATGVFTAAALLAPALMNIPGDGDLSDGPTKVQATDVNLPAAVDAGKAPHESPALLESAEPLESPLPRVSPEPRESSAPHDTRAAPIETPRAAARHDETPPPHAGANVDKPPAAVEVPPTRVETSPARGANLDTTPRTDLTPDPPGKSPSTPGSEQAIPATTPAFVKSSPLPAVWGAAQPPQEAPVRAVLARYAAAYSDLNVDAAASVWPGVNRLALAHAFDNLKSQSVSLGNCQVHVEGDAARARCLGSATWRPRVGGGQRTDARSWNFELERTDAGWQITNARAQNR